MPKLPSAAKIFGLPHRNQAPGSQVEGSRLPEDRRHVGRGLAFLGGMAVGSVVLLLSLYVPKIDVSRLFTPALLENDHVVVLQHNAQPAPAAARATTGVSAIKIAGGKRALTDAPPRMLFAEIKLPTQKRDLLDTPIVVASGKTGLLPLLAEGTRDTRPAIAVMIDDLGVVPDRSAHALRLPKEVTLSFLPYGSVSRPLAQAAAAKGHEIFLHVPMEPRGDANPGPKALMTQDSDRRLRRKLDEQIADIGAVAPLAGINNHMGSRATADRRVMDEVMRGAAERGLAYVDSVTTAGSTARSAAAAHDVAFIARDVFLDHGEGPDFLLAQLDELEQQALSRGVAVAIAHPHETSLEILDVWVKSLKRKGFRLVPISEAIELENRRSLLAMAQ